MTTSVPLIYILTLNFHPIPHHHMESWTLPEPKSNNKLLQSQVQYMHLNLLKIHKTFIYQSHKNMTKYFGKETLNSIKNNYIAKNHCVISLINFNEHGKVIIFNVVGEYIYCLYDIYACLNYLCLHTYKLYNKYLSF